MDAKNPDFRWLFRYLLRAKNLKFELTISYIFFNFKMYYIHVFLIQVVLVLVPIFDNDFRYGLSHIQSCEPTLACIQKQQRILNFPGSLPIESGTVLTIVFDQSYTELPVVPLKAGKRGSLFWRNKKSHYSPAARPVEAAWIWVKRHVQAIAIYRYKQQFLL